MGGLFRPVAYFDKLELLEPEVLLVKGYRWLLLDVDNNCLCESISDSDMHKKVLNLIGLYKNHFLYERYIQDHIFFFLQ